MEERKSAISVRNVCINYKSLKASSIKQSMFSLRKVKQEVFQAVRNVSFEVPEGQILGITGKNGSGKSTMLRAIAGIFSADSGEIDLHGHSISLLAIGVGFKNELSGRENIILSGMLLGFTKEEIMEKMPEIIDFAGIGNFIDMPVRTYSSGMHSKLAFSISAILETEIMLIDEVLSVGDQKFKKKSYRKMKELISNRDRTVVIVSHNMSTLKDLCDQIMWMHDGEIVMYDKPEIVLPIYKDFSGRTPPVRRGLRASFLFHRNFCQNSCETKKPSRREAHSRKTEICHCSDCARRESSARQNSIFVGKYSQNYVAIPFCMR